MYQDGNTIKKDEITIYFSEDNYVTYYGSGCIDLYFDLEYGSKYERKHLLNEKEYLDYEHNDPYSRGN